MSIISHLAVLTRDFELLERGEKCSLVKREVVHLIIRARERERKDVHVAKMNVKSNCFI